MAQVGPPADGDYTARVHAFKEQIIRDHSSDGKHYWYRIVLLWSFASRNANF